MPTYRECGAILAVMLLAGTLGLCSLLDGTSGLTTGGRSKVTFRTNVEQTGLLELTANEKEARIHTLRDQQKFLLKHADVGPINQMVDSMPELVHLLDSGKTPEMLGNNCMLNKLSDAYGDCKATYREGQGDTFVDGPVSDFTTNYANAKTGLDDEKYMEVASSKSRLDLMLLYMKTCHTVDVCMYKEDEQNAKTVAENPVLFMPSEAQCSKVTQVKAEFETGAGAALLQERDRECAAVCPALAFDVEGGTVAVSNNGTYRFQGTLTAFVHYSFFASKGRLLVCDLQGVRQEKRYVLTDPAIHSVENLGRGYGELDLGSVGIEAFFATHTCEKVCRHLPRPAKARYTTLDCEEIIRQKKRSTYVVMDMHAPE